MITWDDLAGGWATRDVSISVETEDRGSQIGQSTGQITGDYVDVFALGRMEGGLEAQR